MIYIFKWKALYTNYETTVQTSDRNIMNMFLSQHGFDPNTSNVIVKQDADQYSDISTTLQLYKFGSRKRDHIYTIATSEEVIMSVIQKVSFELLETMSLGACALKCDYEIFARIDSLIKELDYVYIRETSLNYQDEIEESYQYRHPGYPYSPTYEEVSRDDETDLLSSELYEQSIKDRDQNEILPFTIETYVSTFTSEYLLGEEVTTSGV